MVVDMSSYIEHIPVMLHESVEALLTDTSGIYVDATLGGGGHTREILSRLNEDGFVYGIDQDDEAIAAAKNRIGDDSRFKTIKGNFGYLSTLLSPSVRGDVAGILLDLGVSTHQIKEAERGFSFQQDGPLDMRMGNLTGVSAYQIVNEYEYEKLRDIIFHYGEERNSREIAKAIIQSRPVETTGDLRKIIAGITPDRFLTKTLARVFQAVRIEVNRELDMLKQVLQQSLEVLKPGGRIVAISYHSLEDRLVKRFFKAGNFEGTVDKDFYGNPVSPIRPVTKQVITPSEKEVSENPAARSAKLRAAEKTGEVL